MNFSTKALIILGALALAAVWVAKKAAAKNMVQEEFFRDHADLQLVSDLSLARRLATEPTMAMSLRDTNQQFDGYSQISGSISQFVA